MSGQQSVISRHISSVVQQESITVLIMARTVWGAGVVAPAVLPPLSPLQVQVQLQVQLQVTGVVSGQTSVQTVVHSVLQLSLQVQAGLQLSTQVQVFAGRQQPELKKRLMGNTSHTNRFVAIICGGAVVCQSASVFFQHFTCACDHFCNESRVACC